MLVGFGGGRRVKPLASVGVALGRVGGLVGSGAGRGAHTLPDAPRAGGWRRGLAGSDRKRDAQRDLAGRERCGRGGSGAEDRRVGRWGRVVRVGEGPRARVGVREA